MKKWIVVRLDRYNAVNSDKAVVDADDVEEAFIAGYCTICDIQDVEEAPVCALEISEEGNQAGLDFEEESWFVAAL